MVQTNAEPATGTVPSVLTGLVRLSRPKQLVKNGLVLAVPLAAGELLEPRVLAWTALAFVCLCLAASSIYMLNDVLDVHDDRAHPVKRNRPVASGQVPARVAVITSVVLALVSLGLPLAVMNPRLSAVVAGYLLLQWAYIWKLKHEAVFDIAAIAGGFLLRAIAGGVASQIPISTAFLVVVGFGALFVAIGKRYSEILTHDQNDGQTRKSLEQYSPSYLRILLAMSGTIALVGYILWAFEIDSLGQESVPFAALSIIPFTLALMRYAKDVDSAVAEEPENALFVDKGLLILGAIWLGLFVGQVLQR